MTKKKKKEESEEETESEEEPKKKKKKKTKKACREESEEEEESDEEEPKKKKKKPTKKRRQEEEEDEEEEEEQPKKKKKRQGPAQLEEQEDEEEIPSFRVNDEVLFTNENYGYKRMGSAKVLDDEPIGLDTGWKLIHNIEHTAAGRQYTIPKDQIKLVALERLGKPADYADLPKTSHRSPRFAFHRHLKIRRLDEPLHDRELQGLLKTRMYVVWFSQIMLPAAAADARKLVATNKVALDFG